MMARPVQNRKSRQPLQLSLAELNGAAVPCFHIMNSLRSLRSCLKQNISSWRLPCRQTEYLRVLPLLTALLRRRKRDEEAKITKRMFCFCSVAPPLGTNLLLLLFYKERLVFHFLLSFLSWSFALLNAFVVLRLSFFCIRQILPVHTVAAVASHFPLVQAQNAAPDVIGMRPRRNIIAKMFEDR